jgi:hypothetical protein
VMGVQGLNGVKGDILAIFATIIVLGDIFLGYFSLLRYSQING